ncbi:hypothetical protein GQ54DRAFT_335988 [Martensiomyces pterosporus]|nr:hypothetical protein GQ54DRAFT_335988 [Martensiomyces pterosporus]
MASEANSHAQTLSTILSLGRAKDHVGIGNILSEMDSATLHNLVESSLDAEDSYISGGTSATNLSATIFMLKGGSALIEIGASENGEGILSAVARACVSQICDEDPERDKEDGKKWSGVCDKLLEVLPQLSPLSIIDISFRILAELKACGSTPGPLSSFLPMLLDTLGTVGPVEIVSKGEGFGMATEGSGHGASISRTGSALKAYWVESACSCRWDPKSSVALCALLREIVLSERQIELVANRMLRQLKLVDMNELPAMVYQLLLFARNGLKREIIGGVFKFFDGLEESIPYDEADTANSEARKKWRELGDIEGTVMLHISYSIKQDLELGDALIGYAKDSEATAAGSTTQHTLSTFSFACLLSLARIHRFEDAVTTFLRTVIIKSIHDSITLASTVWVRPYLPAVSFSPQALLNAIVARSSYGWDQVTQSLIQLCLNTIDYVATASKRGAYSASACKEARRICMKALRSAFATHEFVRSELVDQILHRVAFQADSHMQFLGLLGELVADDPDALRVYSSKFVDVFDSISLLSANTVEQLLVSTSPVFLDDSQYRSSLVLVLRKILFAHNHDDRHTALSGLFVLIRGFASALYECRKQSESTGDGRLNRRVQRQADIYSSVLLEMLGLLRRCLTQQPELRSRSYERLALLLNAEYVRCNLFFLNTLHDMFRIELSKYYQGDKGYDSPINIQQCLNPTTHKIIMPMPSFLHCFAKLTSGLVDLSKASNSAALGSGVVDLTGDGAGSSSSAFVTVLGSADTWKDLCVRLAKAQLEDFELDPTGDYSLDNPSGLRNHNTAQLVIGCLDSCLDYALAHCMQAEMSCNGPSCELDNPAMAMELYSQFSRFADVLCSRCLDDKKKRIIGGASELSLISLDAAIDVLRVVLPDKSRVENEGHLLNCGARDHNWFVAHTGKASQWSSNQSFVKHMLEIALARIQRRPNAANTSSGRAQQEADVSSILELAYIVYSGALVYYNSESSDLPTDLPPYLKSKQARGRGVLHLCTEIFAACASALSDRGMADALALAVAYPNPTLFEVRHRPSEQLATSTHALDGARFRRSLSDATQDIVVLATGLRNAVSVLLVQKPAATKEAVHLLSCMLVFTDRLSELVSICGSSDDDLSRDAAYTSLHKTAKWTVGQIYGEIPGDLHLIKSLVAQLAGCQTFLQPESAVTLPSLTYSQQQRHGAPPATSSSDDEELGPLHKLADHLCSASRMFSGDAGSDSEEESDLSMLTPRTVPALVVLITAWLKSELHRVDWAVGQLKRCVQVELAELEGQDDADLEMSIHAERRICYRLCALAQVLMRLLGGSLAAASNDLVIRVFQDMHKSLALLTRAKLATADLPITEAYIDTLSLICSDMNTHAYTVIIEKYGNVGASEGALQAWPIKDKGKSKGKQKGKSEASVAKSRSKVQRDSALVSSLIYQMELTEKYVIQLATKLKTPLAHYLKRSTARDFRIESAALPDPMEIAAAQQSMRSQRGQASEAEAEPDPEPELDLGLGQELVGEEDEGESDDEGSIRRGHASVRAYASVADSHDESEAPEEEDVLVSGESEPETEMMDVVDLEASPIYDSADEEAVQEESGDESVRNSKRARRG